MERNRHTYSAANFYGKRAKHDSDIYAWVEAEPDELIMTRDFISTFNSSPKAFQNHCPQSKGRINERPTNEVITLNCDQPNSSAQQSQQSKPEVDAESLKLLEPRGMLNDIIITCYLTYLQERSEINKTNKLHIFSTFFFTKLKTGYQKLGQGIQEIKQLSTTWHKNMSLMDKEYLVIPACDSNHWSMVIICFPNNIDLPKNNVINTGAKYQSNVRAQPCLLIFDSLGYKFMNKFTRPIRLFLAHRLEYENKRNDFSLLEHKVLPEYTAKVPKQTNSYDCGVHLLYYFEKFLSQPRENYRKIVEGANLDYEWSVDTREQRKVIKRVCSAYGQAPME